MIALTRPSEASEGLQLGGSSFLYPTGHDHPAPTAAPIVVLSLPEVSKNLSAQPDPSHLIDAALPILDPYVTGSEPKGYVLVVLSGTDTASLPGIGWWFWAWGRIPWKYRKYLKRLYIVQPSTFTGSVLSIFLPFLSPRAYSNVYTVSSLLSLYHQYQLPLAGIHLSLATLNQEARLLAINPSSVPPVRLRRSTRYPDPSISSTGSWNFFGWFGNVLGGNKGYESLNSGPQKREDTALGYWGSTPQDLVSPSRAGGIPEVLRVLEKVILEDCCSTEGIFRRSSNSPLIPALDTLLDLPINLQPIIPWKEIARQDPLLPPKYLLRILGEMRDPMIPPEKYDIIRSMKTVSEINDTLLPAFSPETTKLLIFLVNLLHKVSTHESRTRMSPLSLAIVLAPSLINGPDPMEDAQMCMPPGKGLPLGLGGQNVESKEKETGGSTLVGVLELWIRVGTEEIR